MALSKILLGMLEDFKKDYLFEGMELSKEFEYLVNYLIISKFHPDAFSDRGDLNRVVVDDEIRDELAAIDKESNHDEEWINRVQAVLTRADEMIYKENNILFPICAVNFTVEEWYGIYEDAKDYALVYGIENRWEEAEKYVQDKKNRHKAAINEGEIVMGGGHMSVAQLDGKERLVIRLPRARRDSTKGYLVRLSHLGKKYTMVPKVSRFPDLNPYPYGSLYINGQKTSYDLSMSISKKHKDIQV